MATILRFGGKVSDMCWIQCGGVDYDGYVPYGLGIGGGDYIDVAIDLDTGTILKWCGLTEEDVSRACFGDREDEEDEEEDQD